MADSFHNQTDTSGLDLPPGFSAVGLREYKDAMAHAVAIADEAGAGTIAFVRRFDRVEFAVVLEPDEPLAEARRAIYAVMNAAADAISAHVSPEKPVTFDWPDTIRIDGGIVGGSTLAWPEGSAESEVPAWLVAGIVLRSIIPLNGGSIHPYDISAVVGTSLEIEGLEMLSDHRIIESFCRHMMVYVDQWQEFGFGPVGRTYLERLAAPQSRRFTISTSGDLIEHEAGAAAPGARHGLVDALAVPSWRDPATGEPWL